MEAADLGRLVDLETAAHSLELAVGDAAAALRCRRAEVSVIVATRCVVVIVHGGCVVVLVVLRLAGRVVDCLGVVVPCGLVVAPVSRPTIRSLLITGAPVTGLPDQLIQLERLGRVLPLEFVVVLPPATAARIPTEAGIHLLLAHTGIVPTVNFTSYALPLTSSAVRRSLMLLVLRLGQLSQLRLKTGHVEKACRVCGV